MIQREFALAQFIRRSW